MPDVFAGLPCTDRDIAEVALGDFAILTEKAERVAYGEDGTIGAASFTLASAFPFAAQGVQANHVMVIEKIVVPKAAGGTTTKEVDDVLPIASVATNAVTMQRLGYGPGQGAFPKGAGTAAGTITFYVPSLLAQIRTAYDAVMRRLNLTASSPLVEPADIRLAVILTVLRGLYWAQYRQTNDDTFRSKMTDLDAQVAAQMTDLRETYGDRATPGRGVVVGDMNRIEAWCNPKLRWGPGALGAPGWPDSPGW